MWTKNWEKNCTCVFNVYGKVTSKKCNIKVSRWLSYFDLEVKMKCNKSFIFTFPSASTAKGITFKSHFFETVIQHERRDLECFESDRLVILHFKNPLKLAKTAKTICFANPSSIMKIFWYTSSPHVQEYDIPSYHGILRGWRSQLKTLAHSLTSLPWKFEFHIYHSFREKYFWKRSNGQKVIKKQLSENFFILHSTFPLSVKHVKKYQIKVFLSYRKVY